MEKKIGTINGLRGFAILAVIYQHVLSKYTPPGVFVVHLTDKLTIFPLSILSNGWIGVQLFFILSGFVLYLPYANASRQMNLFKDANAYYKRRASRLLPLYYISFLLVFIWWGIFYDKRAMVLREFFLMLTLTFNFTMDMWTPKFNSDLWSIGIEVWFSIFFPLFIIIGRKIGVRRLFFFTAIISLAVRFAGVKYAFFEIPGSHYYSALRDSVFGRMDDFVLGMLICDLYVGGVKAKAFKKPLVFLVAGLLILFIGTNIWDSIDTGSIGLVFAPVTNNFMQAGFFLIICTALSVEAGALKFTVTNRVMQVLGMMSYSLYIWHHLLLRLVTKSDYIFPASVAQPYSGYSMIFYFIVFVLVSVLTYRYIEFGRKDWREIFLVKSRV